MADGSCRCDSPTHAGRLVALTGGPGAGKTALLEIVQRDFCRHVVVLPEAASILFGGGFPRLETVSARRALQRAIFYTTRELEYLVQGQAHAAVALCDRGTVDSLAYWPGEPEDLWSDVHSSLDEELSRYAAVIHLETPDVEHGYDHRNPHRIETPDEAKALDARIASAWEAHPRRFVIEATEGFLEKVVRAVEVINREIPECCRRPWLEQLREPAKA